MLTLGGVGLLTLIIRRRNPLRRLAVFFFAVAFAGFHIAASTMFEYGENMRFQAEISPVLLIIGALGLWSAYQPEEPFIAQSQPEGDIG